MIKNSHRLHLLRLLSLAAMTLFSSVIAISVVIFFEAQKTLISSYTLPGQRVLRAEAQTLPQTLPGDGTLLPHMLVSHHGSRGDWIPDYAAVATRVISESGNWSRYRTRYIGHKVRE